MHLLAVSEGYINGIWVSHKGNLCTGLWTWSCWGRKRFLWWTEKWMHHASIMGSCSLKTSRRCTTWNSNAWKWDHWNPFFFGIHSSFSIPCAWRVEFHVNFDKHFDLYVCPFPSSYAFHLLTPLLLPRALQFTVFTLLMLVSFLSKSSNLFCHLQLLWVAVIVPCKWGKRFIFWPLATTEAGTMQEAGSLLIVVWRFYLYFTFAPPLTLISAHL